MDKNNQIDAVSVRNEYMRNWRHRNADKVRAANQRYWQKKAEKMAKEREEAANADNGKTGA